MGKLRILKEEEKYLGRNIRLKDIPQIELPNYESYVLNDFYDNCKDERLKHFISVVSNNLGHCNFYILYNNLQTLKIKMLNPYYLKITNRNIYGDYDCKKNKIRYSNNKRSKNTYEHELFHTFSSLRTSWYNMYGFMFDNPNNETNFGRGLVESYTYLITDRNFPVKRLSNFKLLSGLIEKMIGQEEMELLYSNANLHELILNLIQYSNESEVINLINKLDYLYFLLHNRKKFIEDISSVNTKIYEMYKDIQKTLFVMLAKKGTDELYDCLENGEYIKRSPGVEFNMFREDQITSYKVLSRGFYEFGKQKQ